MNEETNLLDYLESLKPKLEALSKDDIVSLLLILARNFSESTRNHLLKMINEVNKPGEKSESVELWPEKYRERSRKIDSLLNEIETGEIKIIEREDPDGFEDYRYDPLEEDYWPTYTDDKEFVDTFDEITDFLNLIYSKKYYYRAYELGLKTLSLKVEFVSFYDFIEEYSLYDLEKEKYVGVDFDSILATTLKAAYLKNNNNVDRSKSIIKVYNAAGRVSVPLIELFQKLPIGIEEFRTFIKCLITYLKKDSEEITDKLLREAEELDK